MPEALFTPDGDRFVPSEHVRGPWDRGAMHGGPPAALMGGVMDLLPADGPMMIVRTTVEIFRPVPLHPLKVSARVERDGRRVQFVSASLTEGDVELCRATAWRMRIAELDATLPEPPVVPFAGPLSSTPHVPEIGDAAFHRTGVEMRYARGSFEEQGPATVWMRLRRPVIAGETPTPLQRVLAAADFGNGVASALSWDAYVFINTDLTVALYALPEGEWVCLDASTDLGSRGTGVAYSRLYDEQGAIGHAMQSLFVERRKAEAS